jgi:release factor glutamine methyltransferase
MLGLSARRSGFSSRGRPRLAHRGYLNFLPKLIHDEELGFSPVCRRTVSYCMKVFEALSQAISFLEASTAHPRREAEWLLSFLLKSDRSRILAHYQDELDAQSLSRFFSWVHDRNQGKPIQYITGLQEFRGLEFQVTTEVLIPRPETELVVERALQSIAGRDSLVIDCCTGSGCIAVALAVQSLLTRVIAVDLSAPALEVAKKNARAHNVLDRIQFLAGDLLAPLISPRMAGKLDCIVSNPPYVAEADFSGLQCEVREWEPKVALVAGSDGLAIYDRLIPQAISLLKKRGHLILEIGYNMRDTVTSLFGTGWQSVTVEEDFSGIPRVVVAQRA